MVTYFERLCVEVGLTALDGEALCESDQEDMIGTLTQFNQLATNHANTRHPGHFIDIGFFDSDEVNAFAATWEGIDAIAISWGCTTVLRTLFDSALEKPGFPWVPDHQRISASMWLYECAKHFIFLHELGHIWNGHTSLLNQRGVLPFIEELSVFPDQGLGSLDRQTMEMDADGFAAANIFSLGLYVHKFPTVNRQIEEEYGVGATGLAMASLAIYLVFRMYDEAIDFDHAAVRVHPSAPLRQRMIAGSLAVAAAKENVFSSEQAMQLIVRGMSSAEDVYSRIRGTKRDDEAFIAALGEEGERYLRRLLRQWHILRPQLDPLKRGGVLPPVQDVPNDLD